MDLSTLATNLRTQARANSAIVLDSTVFPSSVLDAIRTAFALAAGQHLTVAGVHETDIPAPENGALTITAGTASALNQDGVSIGLIFTVPAGTLVAIITATMNESWAFSDSFKDLTLFPFPDLAIADAHFVYATAEQTAYGWPSDPSYTIGLQPGLTFLANIALDKFPLIGTLLGQVIGATSFKFYGPFTPVGGQPLPVGTIRAPLGAGTFGIGVAPNALTLGNPAVAVRIGTSDDDNPLQPVDLLVIADFNQTLEFAVGIPMVGSALTISTTPLPNHASINSLIESLPGGSGFTSYIPQELSTVFADIGLDNFTMVFNPLPSPQVTYLGLSISALQPWTVIPDVLILEGLALRIEVVDPAGMNWIRVFIEAKSEFLPHIFTGEFDFTVGLQKQASWEIDTVSGAYYGAVSLGDIVGGLLGQQHSIPAALRAIAFSDFGVSATRSAPGSPFTYSFYGSIEAAFPILDNTLSAQLNLAVTKTSTSYTIDLGGSLVIGEEAFTLALDLGTADSKLIAKWTSTGAPLEFADMASAFGWNGLPALPENLDLGLKDAEFYYDFTAGTVVASAHSVNYGQILFASLIPTTGPNAGQRVYLFALDVPLNLDLSDLPVIGHQIPPNVRLGIQNLQVIAASAELSAADITALNTLITASLSDVALTPTTLGEGLTFAAELHLDSAIQPIVLPLTGGGTQPVLTADVALPERFAAPAPGTAPACQAGAKWFTIGKNFGPAQFQRIGVQYQNSTLFFLLDASLSVAALQFGCNGLGMGSPLTQFKPVPHLDGIAVSFSSGPVTINGGLLNVPASALPPDVAYEYTGELTIAVQPWLIAGVASYAKVSGAPSFFLFAQVSGPFGGPPAFFITGFMGGFGYNSRLALPTPDQVYRFPFVAGLDDPSIFGANPTPMSVLDVLSGTAGSPAWITPTVGENWLAAGISFRSFELVIGHALLVVEFGQEFEVALLGLASVSLPQGAATDAYAYVELQLEAIFKPDEGYFGLTASLTPTSFVLTKDCHLTGGFAFCLWFGPNPHAGDFVVTVGGYHPAFVPPAWYPVPAPVGFNLQIASDVTIKGGAYFALTPSVVMAGGSLEVLFQSGTIKAWFIAYANLLIGWKPFHFTASIGISVGASVRVDLALTTVTLSFELGATLDLWGPPTGGVVHIHLYIISFSVTFGASADGSTPPPLDWSGFQSLLPQASSPTPAPSALWRAGAVAAPLVLGVKINRGLARQDDAGIWYVRADELIFTSETAVPATSFAFGAGGTPALAAGAAPVTLPAAINIRPMNLAAVTSAHTVTVTSIDENKPLDLSAWSQAPQSQNLPEALWGAPLATGTTPAPNSATIPGLPTGVQLRAPPAIAGGSPGAVNIASLVDPLGGGYQPLTPGSQADPIPAPVTDATVITTLMNTLASPAAQTAQNGLIAALSRLQAAPPTHALLVKLAQRAGESFTQAPLRAA